MAEELGLSYTPQDWEKPKGAADYLRYLGCAGKSALRFGKDLALCPGTWGAILGYEFLSGHGDPNVIIASILMGGGTTLYVQVHNAIYNPDDIGPAD